MTETSRPAGPDRFDLWHGCHPPLGSTDGGRTRAAFEQMKALCAEDTKDEVLWRYFTARQDDLSANMHQFLYAQELEAALRDLLDAFGGACPSHDGIEEGCPACHAVALLSDGFQGSLDRHTRQPRTDPI